MNEQIEIIYVFESFRIDVKKRRMFHGDQPVALTSKALNTLLYLIEHRGKIVTKDELMDAVWFDTIVEENNLTQQISTLRKILGERAGEYHFIATVPKQGYSFISPVKEISAVEVEEKTENEIVLQEYSQSNITIDFSNQKDDEVTSIKQIRKTLPRFSKFSSRRVQAAAIISVCLVLIIGIYFRSKSQNSFSGAKETPKTLAVLPFKILNSEGNDDFLGAGISDSLAAKLGNVENLTVRPTSSVIKLAKQTDDPLAAGRELKVDAVLNGSIQRNGDRIRVTVQMLDVKSEKIIWGRSFDENFSDIFSLQDTISTDVAKVFNDKLTDSEQKGLKKHSTENVEAFQAYMRGRYLWNKRDEDSLLKGIRYFQNAVNLDPKYALAYSGIADSYLVLAYYHIGNPSFGEDLQNARLTAQKAIELDDSIAESHNSLAYVEFYSGNSPAAEKEFKRAIELNPNYATAHHWYSNFLATQERDEESLREIKIAANLDPVSPIINATLGEHFYYARNYDEALAQLNQTIELDDSFFTTHYLLGMVYEQKGLYEAAIAEFQKARRLTKNNSNEFDSMLAHAYAVSGNKAEAEKILDNLIKNQADPQAIAIIYAGLGDNERAIEWLKKSDSSKSKLFLQNDPRLDSLRKNESFQRIAQIN